jgi:hypothetical protein
MTVCSTCLVAFDPEKEGMVGFFGIIYVAFCGNCRVGVRDLAEQEWDLVPNEDTDDN